MTALDADGLPTGAWAIESSDRPDLATVDRIARCALVAARHGGRLVLDQVDPEVTDLLALVALRVTRDGSVQVQWQPEGGE